MPKISKKLSTTLSLVLTVFFFLCCVTGLFVLPVLTEMLIDLPDNIGNRGEITQLGRTLSLVSAYCIVLDMVLADCFVFFLLLLVRKGEVFTDRAVSLLRGISWCTLGQFLRKPKVVALCLSIAIVMFAGLSVCNVNALCARYNADRYLSGSLGSIDVEAMEDLGDSAIPSLVRVATAMDAEKDPELKQQIDALLQKKIAALQEEEFSVFSFSIPSVLAKSALKDYTPPVND